LHKGPVKKSSHKLQSNVYLFLNKYETSKDGDWFLANMTERTVQISILVIKGIVDPVRNALENRS
jgi:hypothetical protein